MPGKFKLPSGPGRALVIGITLMVAAWGLSTSPFNSPDEPAHYLRALSLAHGQVASGPLQHDRRRTALAALPPGFDPGAGITTMLWNTRTVTVPAELSPPATWSVCLNGRPDVGTGSCVEGTYTGSYPPISYILPALAVSVASTANSALWLARLGSALLCCAFLLFAAVVSERRGRWAVFGLLIGLSPMAWFMSGVVDPNGLDIAASIAFTSGCLGLAFERAKLPRWVLIGTAISGLVTAITWWLGPLFVALSLVLLLGLLGLGGVRTVIKERWSDVRLSISLLVLALVIYVGYSAVTGLGHSAIGFSPFIENLHAGYNIINIVFDQVVGVFGWLTISLPAPMYGIYLFLAIELLLIAMAAGDTRDRLVLMLSVLFAFALPILLYAWVLRLPLEDGIQGRYVVPVMALAPMLAGDIVSRRELLRSAALDRWIAAIGVGVVAAFDAVALWTNAIRNTSQTGLFPFFKHGAWSPPTGWIVWMLLALAGFASLLVYARGALRPTVPLSSGDSQLATTSS